MKENTFLKDGFPPHFWAREDREIAKSWQVCEEVSSLQEEIDSLTGEILRIKRENTALRRENFQLKHRKR